MNIKFRVVTLIVLLTLICLMSLGCVEAFKSFVKAGPDSSTVRTIETAAGVAIPLLSFIFPWASAAGGTIIGAISTWRKYQVNKKLKSSYHAINALFEDARNIKVKILADGLFKPGDVSFVLDLLDTARLKRIVEGVHEAHGAANEIKADLRKLWDKKKLSKVL